MKHMKAILIDSQNAQVASIALDGSLESLQKVVGGLIEYATCFDNGDVLYVDEEGMLKGHSTYFHIGAHQPFAGNGVIVGTDEKNGTTTSCKSTTREIANKVWFMDSLGVHVWLQEQMRKEVM